LLGFFNRSRRDRELAAELESHVQLHIDDNLRAGMTPDEARRQAHVALGGLEQTKERYRDRRELPPVETLLRDVQFGTRILLRKPGFTAGAVLTLALGIGANSAIFSVVYAVLLRPLPFQDPDRLVSIEKQNPARGWTRNNISSVEFLEWQRSARAFSALAAFAASSCVLTGAGEPEELPCEIAEGHLFDVLGVRPVRGRAFVPEEDRIEGEGAAILSYGLWQRRFGADEGVIGRTLSINGIPRVVVGVMPEDFIHAYTSPYRSTPQLWLSGIGLSGTNTSNDYFAVGRLRPDASLPQAAAEMDGVSVRLDDAFPAIKGWRAQLFTLREMTSGDERQLLLLLLGAVVCVLLIACANVANLMLSHNAARASELALRQSLGASRLRIVRQLLTESALISIAGGAFGLFLAWWGTKGLAYLAPPYIVRVAPELSTGAVEPHVLAFTFVTAVGTCLLFGLGPAIRGTRTDVTTSLKEMGRGSVLNARSARYRGVLVVSEIALALVLLAGAGLMMRTVARLSGVNLGFRPEHVLTMRVPLSGARYADAQSQADFWLRLTAAVGSLPGVEAVSVARGLPVDDWAGQYISTAEHPNPPAGQAPDANYIAVGPDYFRTLEIPVRRGRAFTERDAQGAARVAIVNEDLARRIWPGENPLGKRLRTSAGRSAGPWLEVVGVAGNVLSQGQLEGYHAELYVPYLQYPWVLSPRNLILRAQPGVDPATLADPIVEAIHRLDANQPVADISLLKDAVSGLVGAEKMLMSLLATFAGLALVLAAVGTYSVLAYGVAQRTREIGLRVALGARHRDVLRLVARQGLMPVGTGIVIGVAAALGLTQLLDHLLYGVGARDPATFGGVTILIVIVSMVACYIPARRALHVDPMVALRVE
jgi:putative ABC transport system permease protein